MSRAKNIKTISIATLIMSLAFGSLSALASEAVKNADLLQSEIAQQFPGARIEITSPYQLSESADSVKLLGILPRGEAQFQVSSEDSNGRERFQTLKVNFNAWVLAPVAVKRVHPGEKLSADQFKTQEVNLSSGSGFEYRGIIASKATVLEQLEARQTILEGQFLITTAVQKIPDVRRGDLVRLELQSEGLTLTTQGVAQEPAYINAPVRVLASKTKKELTGKLTSSGVVEVKL